MTAPRGRAELAIAFTAFLWGSTFTVVKEALQDISTFLFLALRFSIGALLLLGVYHGRFSGKGDAGLFWRAGLVTGTLLFFGYSLQTAGLHLTSASKSAFLTGLYIVLVPFLASIVHRNRPRVVELVGAAAGSAGTALLSAQGADWSLGPGEWLTVGCAAAFAAHMLAVEHYSRRMSYELLAVLQVAAVGAWSLVALPWLESPRVVWSGRVWFALALTAVFATAVSFALYTWAQRHTSAARAALLFALEPVFAGLVAWIVSGEVWTFRMLAGAALILGGILMVELKPRLAAQHP